MYGVIGSLAIMDLIRLSRIIKLLQRSGRFIVIIDVEVSVDKVVP